VHALGEEVRREYQLAGAGVDDRGVVAHPDHDAGLAPGEQARHGLDQLVFGQFHGVLSASWARFVGQFVDRAAARRRLPSARRSGASAWVG
jgi:hypothetical protein